MYFHSKQFRYLAKPVYQQIFQEDYNGNSQDDRIKMTSIVYLLMNLGVNIGNYDFGYYNGTLYSENFQQDLSSLILETDSLPLDHLSDREMEKIGIVREIIEEQTKSSYTKTKWAYLIALIYYILTVVFDEEPPKEAVFDTLRNTQYINSESNQTAYELVKELLEETGHDKHKYF